MTSEVCRPRKELYKWRWRSTDTGKLEEADMVRAQRGVRDINLLNVVSAMPNEAMNASVLAGQALCLGHFITEKGKFW